MRAGVAQAGRARARPTVICPVAGDQAEDRVERGRLAGAVRPDQADHLAGADAQRHAAHRLHRAVGRRAGRRPRASAARPHRAACRGRSRSTRRSASTLAGLAVRDHRRRRRGRRAGRPAGARSRAGARSAGSPSDAPAAAAATVARSRSASSCHSSVSRPAAGSSSSSSRAPPTRARARSTFFCSAVGQRRHPGVEQRVEPERGGGALDLGVDAVALGARPGAAPRTLASIEVEPEVVGADLRAPRAPSSRGTSRCSGRCA